MTFYSVGFLIVLSQIILSLALSYILKIKWEEKPYTAFFTLSESKTKKFIITLIQQNPLWRIEDKEGRLLWYFSGTGFSGDFIVIGNNLNRDRDTGVQCKVDTVLL